MTEMTPERLAEIRERAESVKTWKGYHAEPVPQLLDVDVPALVAEVERLRAEAQERAEEIADFERTRDELAAARRQAEEDRDDALREAERARTVAANAEKTLGEQIDRAVAAEAERDRLAEQVERDRALVVKEIDGWDRTKLDAIGILARLRDHFSGRTPLDGTEAGT